MLIGYAAAWQSTDVSRTLMSCVDAGIQRWMTKDRTVTEEIVADRLGVKQPRLSAMRAGIDAGPGFLRFGNLPKHFWIGFMKEWGVQFAVTVITDFELQKQIKFINWWMVRTMQRDAARMYPGEVFPDYEEEQERSA